MEKTYTTMEMLTTYGDMLLLLKLGETAVKNKNIKDKIIEVNISQIYEEIRDEVDILIDKFNTLSKERRVMTPEIVNEIVDRLSRKFVEYKFRTEE